MKKYICGFLFFSSVLFVSCEDHLIENDTVTVENNEILYESNDDEIVNEIKTQTNNESIGFRSMVRGGKKGGKPKKE